MRVLRSIGDLTLDLLVLVGVVVGGLLMLSGAGAILAGLVGAYGAPTNLNFIRFGLLALAVGYVFAAYSEKRLAAGPEHRSLKTPGEIVERFL